MFPLVYAAVGVIPVVTATFSIIQEFTMIKGIVLGLLVTVTVYVGIVRRELLNKRFS